jgi:hypothetical protein
MGVCPFSKEQINVYWYAQLSVTLDHDKLRTRHGVIPVPLDKPISVSLTAEQTLRLARGELRAKSSAAWRAIEDLYYRVVENAIDKPSKKS